MSQKLIDRSPDLSRLRSEGYNLEIIASFLLVRDVPYVNSKREVRRGTLVMKLDLAGDVTVPPDTHVAYLAGDYPCREDGTPIEQIRHASKSETFAAGVVVDHSFSAKPKAMGRYEDYYAKATTYCAILSGPAQAIDPSVTARTFSPIVVDDQDNSVFNYIDTASGRAGICAITEKLALGKVAVVGLGGTGAYVLDLVAKTPVQEIHLFDGDDFLTHNAFRTPGAPSLEELRARSRKVAYFASTYSRMRRGIIPHPIYIDAQNVELLRPMDFVFLCVDDGAARKLMTTKLHEWSIPFVDVGMGIYAADEALGGIVRVTTSTPSKSDHVPARVPLADRSEEDRYDQNIQIADLNALNAALAVIRWKKFCGFYLDLANEHHSTYGIEIQLLTKEDAPG